MICNQCKHKINDLPFRCSKCGQHFCSEHRLPEEHRCEWLKTQVVDWESVLKEKFEKPYRPLPITSLYEYRSTFFSRMKHRILYFLGL